MDKRDQNGGRGGFRLLLNRCFDAAQDYPEDARRVISLEALEAAATEMRSWPEYETTPLHALEELARNTGVAQVWLKDESGRFGLGSFKAIGGAYGCLRALQAKLAAPDVAAPTSRDLRSGAHTGRTAEIVLACATDGNHGRAVAWAARAFGCRCEVFVPRIVSLPRRQQIETLGASVRRIEGTYDDALRALDSAAGEAGWVVVSDQAYAGYERIPRDIMQGYAVVAQEAIEALPAATPPTHVFVQAGVGGFAAAICGYLWERFGSDRPRFTCVEPIAADCLYQAAMAGGPVTVPGDLDTVMACLSCGEASPLGWTVLNQGAAAFVAIEDGAAVDAMKFLAAPGGGQMPLVVGESGAAGVAALMRLCTDEAARRELGLNGRSRVLLFATEGATDPQAYASLVGLPPGSVVGGATRG